MLISIIIPTYNRIGKLNIVLKKLMNCTDIEKCELIIINDGSTDSTKKELSKISIKIPFKYINQKNSGPARARNIGILNARGKFVLFMGDDIIPSISLISEHIRSLNKHPNSAILGFTKWDPAIKRTEFMDFLAPYGPQFNYNIKNNKDAGYSKFWTCNISLAKKWFNSELFDEKFKYAAYEDTELAYRLCKKGLKIEFNSHAIAYHSHEYNLIENFLKRQESVGKAGRVFVNKHKVFLFRLVIRKACIMMLYYLLYLITNRKIYRWQYLIRKFYFKGFFYKYKYY